MNLIKLGKLRLKVLLAMLMAAVIPLLVLGILAIFSLNYFHKLDVESIEQTLLDEISAETDDTINRVVSTFQLQVTFDQTTDIALSDQHLLLQQLMVQFPDLQEASFISTSDSQYGQETAVLNRELPDEFAPSGDLINQKNVEKFQLAAKGQNYVSPVYFTLNGPMVTIATPVKNTPKTGAATVISVLSGEIKLTALHRIIYQAHLGNSGYLYLADNSGFMIEHSLGQGQPGMYIAPMPQQNLASYTSFWGQKVAGMSRKLKSINLNLAAEWPTADADQIVNIVEQQIIWASVLVVLLALALSFYLASKIIKPIKILESGAALVAEGKFDKHVDITTQDELQQLGEAFNKMMDGLKRLEELKEEFVFVASHELRTPVTAMKGYLSMVTSGEAGPVSPQVMDMLKQVSTSNERLMRLVEDLLQVARSEAGRLTIEVAPIHIGEQVLGVLKELEPLAKEKNIVVGYAPNPELPIVSADPSRVKEVLINLVGNAIKYTPAGGKVIINHQLQEGQLVTNIKDNGIGMSREEQQKLFQKFYRVKNSNTKNIQGTGLGLFIVKEIVEKMNGKIWVASESGQGSIFSFSLQLAKKS